MTGRTIPTQQPEDETETERWEAQKEVVSRLKELIVCQDICGDPKCTREGTPTKKNGHVRLCPCIHCRNRKNNRRGKDRQSQGVKRTLAFTGKFMPSNEESLNLPFRYEHKDGVKARTVVTAYERERRQSEQAHSIGDPRGFVAGYSVDGKHSYYVLRSDELEQIVVGLAEAWGLGEAS